MLLIHHVKQQPEIDPILSPTAAPTPPWPGEAFPNPAVVEFFFFSFYLCVAALLRAGEDTFFLLFPICLVLPVFTSVACN